MSENIHHGHEKHSIDNKAEKAEHIDSSRPEQFENDRPDNEQKRHELSDNIDQIRDQVEENSSATADFLTAAGEQQNASPAYVQKELQDISYERTLRRIRRRLNPAERSFSRFVHLPVVEVTSDVFGKTIARPSALLYGGVFALIGSGLLLMTASRNGFEYNYLMIVLLYVLGMVTSYVVDFAAYLWKKRKGRS